MTPDAVSVLIRLMLMLGGSRVADIAHKTWNDSSDCQALKTVVVIAESSSPSCLHST